ncbi:MAG: M28 family peptidase [Gemmatimonadales bacterium]|nr:M28 family peptidase [Gemmatimonadales bacterium]
MKPDLARLALLALTLSGPLAAQAPSSTPAITPTDMRRRIEIIADDSMMGRDTPSPGLERAATYVAGEFRRLGLRPGADGGYEQRWGISRWVPDTAGAQIEIEARGARARPRLGRDARYVGGDLTGREIAGDAVLLAGPVTRQAVADPRLRGHVVLLVVDYRRSLQDDLGERVDQIAATASAVLLLSDRDSTIFARRLESAASPRLTPDFRLVRQGAPVLEVHERALGPVLAAAGIDLAELRSSGAATTSSPPLRVSLRLPRRAIERARVPNLVAVLEGADPGLRGEYVVISAHVDGVGLRPGARDSINNGADDNGSGVAGLLELAEAFAAPGARPGRSLLFLASSGEEKGLWGSAYYVERPTVPLRDLVAVVNLDLIGRNWRDSVIAVGPDFSSLGETLTRVTQAHPELEMTPLADRWPEERIFLRSDHYHFARRGVPILFFTSGTHPDYHQPTDSADRVDVDKASRLVRLLYHLTAAIGNDPARPRWSPERYREIVRQP